MWTPFSGDLRQSRNGLRRVWHRLTSHRKENRFAGCDILFGLDPYIFVHDWQDAKTGLKSSVQYLPDKLHGCRALLYNRQRLRSREAEIVQ